MTDEFNSNGPSSTASGGFINHAIIDKESGTTVSGTTNLPKTLFTQSSPERDVSASRLLSQTNPKIGEAEAEVLPVVHGLLEKSGTSEPIRKQNVIMIFNSNIYGSAIGGDVKEAHITSIQQWNQIKNEIDVEQLLTELNEAIKSMQAKATEGEHYSDLANVTFARDELKKADGPATLRYLKKVGSFGFDIVKGMGAGYLLQLLMGG